MADPAFLTRADSDPDVVDGLALAAADNRLPNRDALRFWSVDHPRLDPLRLWLSPLYLPLGPETLSEKNC